MEYVCINYSVSVELWKKSAQIVESFKLWYELLLSLLELWSEWVFEGFLGLSIFNRCLVLRSQVGYASSCPGRSDADWSGRPLKSGYERVPALAQFFRLLYRPKSEMQSTIRSQKKYNLDWYDVEPI